MACPSFWLYDPARTLPIVIVYAFFNHVPPYFITIAKHGYSSGGFRRARGGRMPPLNVDRLYRVSPPPPQKKKKAERSISLL